MAVVIMEPLRGGRLIDPPEPIQEIWDSAPGKRTPADWALQWLWNQPEVSVVLSGMTEMAHVVENVASANSSGPGTLTVKELEIIEQVREKYREFSPIPCTGCGYCMPCPNGVNIPRNFDIYNEGVMYGKPHKARSSYRAWLTEAERASACIQCHECEEQCPQRIPISEWMPRIHQVLAEGQPYPGEQS